MRPPRDRHATAVQFCHATATGHLASRNRRATAIQSPFNRHATATQPPQANLASAEEQGLLPTDEEDSEDAASLQARL